MNDNALAVYWLTKKYNKKAILDLGKNAGIIELLGKKEQKIGFDTRNRVGVIFDNNNFPDSMSPSSLGTSLPTHGLRQATHGTCWNMRKIENNVI